MVPRPRWFDEAIARFLEDGFLSQVTFHRSQVKVTAIVHPNETCFYCRYTLGLASFY